jgi:hypothetical protein
MKMKTTSLRSQFLLAVLVLSAPLVRAQSVNGNEDPTNYGSLSQNNSGITYSNNLNVQPVACMPTSFANALAYLNGVNGNNVFTFNPGTYTTLNNLANYMGTSYTSTTTPMGTTYSGGTSYLGGVQGFQAYSAATGTNPAKMPVTIGGQYATSVYSGNALGATFTNVDPTASYLANALNSKDAVELWIDWGDLNGTDFTATGGAHIVDLFQLNLSNGSGTAEIVDPQSFTDTTYNDPNATAQQLEVNVTTDAHGDLVFTYPTSTISGAPGEVENGSSTLAAAPEGEQAVISADFIEAVPEPSSWVLGLLCVGGFAALRFRAARNN